MPAPKSHEAQTGILRLTTCGAVDDCKSTLLGRLLIDAGAVYEDHLAALYHASAALRPDLPGADPSLLFDGLAAEREQGITIDLAYRYFATERRRFVIADASGHEAHTRNMATAASNADLAVIVVDAVRGVSAQTLRHIATAGLVGVRRAIVAINKMDAAAFDSGRFEALRAEVEAACAASGVSVFSALPLSARDGDNVVQRSPRTPWHHGATLLQALETVDVASAAREAAFRFS